jgi:hypothetical protein
VSAELTPGAAGQPFAGLAIAGRDRGIELGLTESGDLFVHDRVGHRRCTALLDRAARHQLAVALLNAVDALLHDDRVIGEAVIDPGVGRGRAEVAVVAGGVLISVFDAWGSSSRSIRLDQASVRRLASEAEAAD